VREPERWPAPSAETESESRGHSNTGNTPAHLAAMRETEHRVNRFNCIAWSIRGFRANVTRGAEGIYSSVILTADEPLALCKISYCNL
jgi:hypothetical protein